MQLKQGLGPIIPTVIPGVHAVHAVEYEARLPKKRELLAAPY